LHRQIGPLYAAVPVDEVAFGLGVAEIRREDLEGCEGVLLTDRVRSQGKILVNTRRGQQAARFSIAHELGHFLLERHVLGIGGRFTCTIADLREIRTAKLHQRQEAEANTFAIGLLAPDDQLAPYLRDQPEIASVLALRSRLDISIEAAARCLVDRHVEPIAAIHTVDGKIRYTVRGKAFPWIERGAGEMISSLSWTAHALNDGPCLTNLQAVPVAAWTNADIPELYEQVRIGREGHALTLLWATLPNADRDGGDDD
jgi:IrrE N-terminal-like domain